MFCHNDAGAARIHPGSLSVGLAAAVVIDLYSQQRVALEPAGLVRNPFGQSTTDPITESAFASLRHSHHPVPLNVWMRGFAQSGIYERVQANLNAVGILRRQSRVLRSDAYVPVDTVWSVRIHGYLRSVLNRREKPDWQCVALAGLIVALGVHDHLYLIDNGLDVHNGLRRLVSLIDQQVQDITTAAAHVVGDIAVAVYR